MPDAGAGRKRQIRGFRIRRYLRALARPGSLASDRRHRSVVRTSQTRRRFDNHCLRESPARLIQAPVRARGLFHLDRAICKNAVAQAWINVARRVGNQCAVAAAGFVLSLPDKGFCKLIRAVGTWAPKWGR